MIVIGATHFGALRKWRSGRGKDCGSEITCVIGKRALFWLLRRRNLVYPFLGGSMHWIGRNLCSAVGFRTFYHCAMMAACSSELQESYLRLLNFSIYHIIQHNQSINPRHVQLAASPLSLRIRCRDVDWDITSSSFIGFLAGKSELQRDHAVY